MLPEPFALIRTEIVRKATFVHTHPTHPLIEMDKVKWASSNILKGNTDNV